MGHGRTERQEPAWRQDGRRHLQRQRRAQADGCGGSAAAIQRLSENRQRPRVRSGGEWQRPSSRRERQRQRQRPSCRRERRGASRGAGRRRFHERRCADADRGGDDHPVGRARNRGDAPSLSIRRERVSDRRSGLPPARRPRSADGHRPRREALRDHRAGKDRDDPQLAPDRSTPADRRSRGRDEVQGAAARGGAEARGRAAEPDADRRHRVRGGEAARHAETAGGEGAALPASARRAPAVGEGAVRAQVPPARGDDRVRARAPGRGARTRVGRSRARRGARSRSRARAHRAGGGGDARDRVA